MKVSSCFCHPKPSIPAITKLITTVPKHCHLFLAKHLKMCNGIKIYDVSY